MACTCASNIDGLFHCLIIVRIRSFSGLHFSAFGLSTERYVYPPVFDPNAGKYRPEKLQLRTLFMQCVAFVSVLILSFLFRELILLVIYLLKNSQLKILTLIFFYLHHIHHHIYHYDHHQYCTASENIKNFFASIKIQSCVF